MDLRSKINIGIAALVVLLPNLAGAVTLLDTLNLVNTFLNAAIPMIITLALIYFFWGLAQFLLAAGSEESREGARWAMIYGVMIIFVMVSIWGIVRLLQSTFKVTSTDPIIPKAIQLQNTGSNF